MKKKMTEFQMVAERFRASRLRLPYCSSVDAYAQADRSLRGMTLPPTSGGSFGGSVLSEAKSESSTRPRG